MEVPIAKEQRLLKHRVNENIKSPTVKLIDDEGKALGDLPLQEALALAASKGLDLVEIGKNQKPPICKLMNYGKFCYQESKKSQNFKKKQRVVQVKELKIRPKIESHDLEVKVNRAKAFLADGHKVKFTLQFRGREVTHKEIGTALLDKVTESLSPFADVESHVKSDFRNQIVVYVPITKKSTDK